MHKIKRPKNKRELHDLTVLAKYHVRQARECLAHLVMAPETAMPDDEDESAELYDQLEHSYTHVGIASEDFCDD